MNTNNIIATKPLPFLLIRWLVGLVFISEGIQKFLFPDLLGPGRFAQIGFSHPGFWADFTAGWEITAGLLLLLGFLTRLAAIPLLIIMGVAFYSTKVPLLLHKGFWPMAHDYRTDFAMTILLILLLVYGGGNHSLDIRIHEKRSSST
jgi:uncharacterized membrane protein YphA (DoxX/SURF4 family)